MVDDKDPRLTLARHQGPLAGTESRRKTYRAYSPDWRHDHCVACWVTLAEYEGPGYLHEGYAVTEAYPDGGEDYDWVCVTCCEAIKEQMEWIVVG